MIVQVYINNYIIINYIIIYYIVLRLAVIIVYGQSVCIRHRCEFNCKLDIDPASELILVVLCPSDSEAKCSISADNDVITYRWNVEPQCSSAADELAVVIDWERDTLTGNTQDRLVIKPNVFQQTTGRRTYEITVHGSSRSQFNTMTFNLMT